MNSPYLDLHQFAAQLRVSYSTARRMCEAGEVPGAKKVRDRLWRIPESAHLLLEERRKDER